MNILLRKYYFFVDITIIFTLIIVFGEINGGGTLILHNL